MDSRKDNKREQKPEPEPDETVEQYKYKSQKQMDQLRTYVYQTEIKDHEDSLKNIELVSK